MMLPACYDCQWKTVLKFGSEILHDKDPKVGIMFDVDDIVVSRERNFHGHRLVSFLWETKFVQVLIEKR